MRRIACDVFRGNIDGSIITTWLEKRLVTLVKLRHNVMCKFKCHAQVVNRNGLGTVLAKLPGAFTLATFALCLGVFHRVPDVTWRPAQIVLGATRAWPWQLMLIICLGRLQVFAHCRFATHFLDFLWRWPGTFGWVRGRTETVENATWCPVTIIAAV